MLQLNKVISDFRHLFMLYLIMEVLMPFMVNKILLYKKLSLNSKIGQDLDGFTTEPDFTEAVENLELNWSGWVYDRIDGMHFDLYRTWPKAVVVVLFFFWKRYQIFSLENDNLCKVWCITDYLQPAKLNLCTKIVMIKHFKTMKTPGINLAIG